MKHSLIRPLVCAVLAASFGTIQLASADPFNWTGASGTDLNWATAGNWDPSGPPAMGDDAQFFDDGAAADTVTADNVVAADITVQSLWLGQTNGIHNTLINPGVTLTLQGENTSPAILFAGTMTYVDSTTVVSNTISGAGGTLTLDNTNNIMEVRQSHGSSGAHYALLDLSGLDTFNANLQEFRVGVGTSSSTVVSRRSEGHLFLAKTNLVTVRGSDGDPGLLVGDNSGNNNGNSSYSDITLGQQNILNADYVRIGGQKQQGRMYFADGLVSPTLTVRGSDGAGRVTDFAVGDEHEQGGSGNPTTGTVDLSGGTVDLLVDTLYVGRSQTGNGREATGHLTLGTGMLDVNSLELGYEDAASNTRSGVPYTASGDLNLNGTIVVVNNLLRFGHEEGADYPQIGILNMNGGSLVASNAVVEGPGSSISLTAGASFTVANEAATLGTSLVPLDSFTMDDSTLTVPGNGNLIVTTNFSSGGSGNTINITSLPRISEYPAEIPLIRYTVTGGSSTITLGSLPPGSPAYSGYISNDFVGSVILVLTTGPVSVPLDWDGTVNGDWDTITANWLKMGTNSTYTEGDPVRFSDSATGPTTINLTEPISPTGLQVSNNAATYTFTGPGSLSGAAGIKKKGTGTLFIMNEGNNDFGGNITVDAGTVQIGDGGTNGNMPQVSVANEGTFVFNRSDDFSLSAGVSGSGTLTKMGAGSLTLSSGADYTGPTVINGGKLAVNGGFLTSGGAISVAAGAAFAPTGDFPYVSRDITSSGRIDPGDDGVPVYAIASTITMNAGGTLKFDFTDDPVALQPNDILQLDTLNLNNTTIEVGFQGLPLTDSPYGIIYYGSETGSFNPTVVGTHYTATLDDSAGTVSITFTGSGASLKWASTNDNVWSGTASNWFNSGSGLLEPFYAGDSALFDDSVPNIVTNIVIPAGVRMAPLGLTVNSSANDYTINGDGAIGGTGTDPIVKNGTSTLTLATANDFDSPVQIMAGTFKAGTSSALGSTLGDTTIASGATLDVNGQQLNAEFMTAAGSGVGGAGAIINSGPQQLNAIGTLTLTGNTTFGGTGRWDIRGGGSTLSTSGAGYNLTKVGPNQVSLVATTVDPALGDIDVQEGVFSYETSSSSLGNPANSLFVRAGATLQFYQTANAMDKQFQLFGSGTNNTLYVADGSSAQNIIVGPMSLTGDCWMSVNGGDYMTFSNTISGGGNLTKTDSGTLQVASVNNYTGDTTVSGGTLALLDSSTFDNSPAIAVGAGATLDVTGTTSGMLTLASGQTLRGGGNITGTVVAGSGTTVAPGASIGTLTVSGDVTLGGTTIMEVDANAAPNSDNLAAANIAYGGTLVVTNIGDAIYGTNTFQLFSASLSGSFTTVTLPTLADVTWDTSNLEVDGSIMAIGPTQVTPPTVQIGVESGTDVILSGTGGTPNADFTVLTSTNVSLPLSNWTAAASGAFDGSGAFSITNAFEPGTAERFYLIQQP